MTPAERAVIEAAGILVDNRQEDGAWANLVTAVDAWTVAREEAEDMRPWHLVVAEDEIWSTRNSKWYRVIETHLTTGGMVAMRTEGMAKAKEMPAEAMVKVRRSEMGQAVDVWAGIEVMSS